MKKNNSSKMSCNRTNKVNNKANNNIQANKNVRKDDSAGSKSFEIDPNDEHSFNLR